MCEPSQLQVDHAEDDLLGGDGSAERKGPARGDRCHGRGRRAIGGGAVFEHGRRVAEAEVRDALLQLDPLWDELFPAEQTRIVQLLVERVEIAEDGLGIRLRTDGLTGLVREYGVDARAAA